MSFDGIVTKAVVDDLKEKIVGGKINKVNQPDKNEIILSIYKDKKTYKLLITASSSFSRMHFTDQIKENPLQVYNFCMLLRKYLQGALIKSVEQISMDRIVFIEVQSRDEMGYPMDYYLVVELMGKHSNIILIQKDSLKIIDSIKHLSFDENNLRQIIAGSKYEFLTSDKYNVLETYPKPSEIKADKADKLAKFFYKNYEGYSPTISSEIALRAGVDPDKRTDDLSDDEWKAIDEQFSNIVSAIRDKNFVPSIVYNEDKRAKDFHVIELKKYGYRKEGFESLHQMLDAYYKKNVHNDSLNQKKSHLKKVLKTKLSRNENKLSNLKLDLLEANDRQKYKIYADLISSNYHVIEKGEESVIVDNFYDDMKKIEIPLDSSKSAHQNAQYYYKLYGKLKKRQEVITEEIPVVKEENRYIEQLINSLDNVTGNSEVEEIKDEMSKEGLIKRGSKKKSSAKPSKPRHFVTANNVDIYVGKNNYQNDKLTLKTANKDDYFFHAKDIPGSHVIMRNDNINDDDIATALQLAAYYSSGKDENYVEVDYTQKKNVRKAKGAKPGMVFYENFTTVNVDIRDFVPEKVKEII
ncbi:MAG: NFACT RNA binding domain-containing protein [Finegoldia sp.]|nr:NFACT RNA binding domain-containing protein [Finegoldia sp.]